MKQSVSFTYLDRSHAYITCIIYVYRFIGVVSGYLGVLFTFAYLWPITRIVKLIVAEKETRVSEGFQIMGLYRVSLWLSWLITYTIGFLLTAILIMLISKSFFPNTDMLLVFIIFFFYGLNSFGIAYVFSSAFDKVITLI